jgi:hypothetical protein
MSTFMWENSLKGRAVSIRPRSDRRIPPSRRGHQIVIAYCIDSREEHGQNEDMLPRRKRGCWMVSPVVCRWLVLLTLSASAAIWHVTTAAHA